MQSLERGIGLPGAIAIAVSTMLGSGIFVLPGMAAAKTGASLWLAYLLAGLVVLPAALSKAELGTAIPSAGGTYVYLDRTFGPLAGTVAGFGLWVVLLLKSAFALVGFSAYLEVLAPLPLKPTALALLALIVALNVLGVKHVSRAQKVVVVLSVGGLGVLIVGGFVRLEPRRFEPFLLHGPLGLLDATAFVYLSYAGVTKIAAIAEELKEPARDLPWGIIVSLLIVTSLYALVSLALVGAVPLEVLHGDLRPIYGLGHAVGGRWLGLGAALLGVVTMVSMANAGLLATSRFPYAMARDRLVPRLLAALHPRFLTPVASILLSGAVMAAAIALLAVDRIAKLGSAFQLIMFAANCICLIVLRESRVPWYRPSFKLPLYPWVPLFGVVATATLLVALGPVALTASAALGVVGVLLFFGYGRRHTDRRSVLGKLGPRTDLVTRPLPAVARAPREVSIASEASALVALFGRERSPEMLVEVGAAIADSGLVEVVALTEVPEQTILAPMPERDAAIASVARRLRAMAEERGLEVEFNAIVSRDMVATLYELSERLHCRWVVMAWGGRPAGGLTLHNPVGWLRDHLSCNLAIFHDAGVRYVRRVLVDVEPGPHDALVLGTAEHLAAVWRAELTLARFVPDGASPTETQAAADYLDQLRGLCSCETETVMLRGKDEVETLAQASVGYDLMVVGAVGAPDWRSRLLGTRRDRLTERAACSVLRLQTPLARTHEAFDRQRARAGEAPRGLLDHLDPACVDARVAARTKDEVFQHIARVFAARVAGAGAPEQILAALKEREATQNTAVGDGLALPHATLAEVARTCLGVFTLAEPVDYGAPDGRRVDVVFATVGAPGHRQDHLYLLSGIARLVTLTDAPRRLRDARTADELRAALTACAAELEERASGGA